MKYLALIPFLVFAGLAGCGGHIVAHSRWTADYCDSHRNDYHHAHQYCRTRGDHASCVYADDWEHYCLQAYRLRH